MSTKKSLSVIILTKNEAPLLADCLLSVAWADEIIIVDSGSEDETLGIAQHYGAKIYTHTDWPGFGKQRNIAQQYAKGDYILMVDADERVSPLLKNAIKAVLMAPPDDKAVYSCARRNLFLGRFMRYSGWYPDRVVRLYPPQYQYKEDYVHESLMCSSAKIIPLKGDLLHLTCRDFSDFQQKQLNYAKVWAVQRHQQGKSCHYLAIFGHTLWAFCKTGLLHAGFLDGKQGLLLACVNAQYTFTKYTALWSLNQSQQQKSEKP